MQNSSICKDCMEPNACAHRLLRTRMMACACLETKAQKKHMLM